MQHSDVGPPSAVAAVGAVGALERAIGAVWSDGEGSLGMAVFADAIANTREAAMAWIVGATAFTPTLTYAELMPPLFIAVIV